MEIGGNGGGGGSPLTVTDGVHTVSNTTNITFLSGATVANGGGGIADITITAGVSSFTSPNSTLTVAGTTNLTADLNLNNDNAWGGKQTFNGGAVVPSNTLISFISPSTIGLYSTGNDINVLFGGSSNVASFGLGGIQTYSGFVGNYLFFGAGASSGAFQTTAPGVAHMTGAGASGLGWLQNSAGEAALASNYTNSTATFSNTALSFTVIAGRSYRIEGYIIASNSAAAEGVQFDFNGGSATATTFDISTTDIGSNVLGSAVSTSLAGVINYTTVTGSNKIWFRGYLKVNAGGTFIMRAAENTHVAGTLTLGAGSWLALYDTINY